MILYNISLLVLLISLLCPVKALVPNVAETENNDFAEFEDFDDEMITDDFDDEIEGGQDFMDVNGAIDSDADIEDEEDSFDVLDEDEFEGFDTEKTPAKGKIADKPQELKINKIPMHLRTNWDNFYLEMLMLAGLGVYFLNFLHGKSKNSRLAQAWLSANKQLLQQNFAIVGDDGVSKEVQNDVLMKESENVYSLWCSGRTVCEGMLVTLKLLKRQDIVSTISRIFNPTSDQIIVKITLDEYEMDTFVLCLANKKICGKMQKDLNDLSLYCPEKKNAQSYGFSDCFHMLSEIAAATTAVFDKPIVAAINKYESMIEFIHISDQYSGPVQQQEENTTKQPETSKVIIICFNVPGKGRASINDIEAMTPLMQIVFHILDRVAKIKLGKESKAKAEKNRNKVLESLMKATHAQRQEAAQQRREEKRKAEKERIMNEEDPEKQRRWEERDNKREAKKKQARVKMMKIKAM